MHEGFVSLVRACWSEPTSGSLALVVIKKLKRLKARLRIWNRDVFRNVHEKLDIALTSLHDIQRDIDLHGDINACFDLEMNTTFGLMSCLLVARLILHSITGCNGCKMGIETRFSFIAFTIPLLLALLSIQFRYGLRSTLWRPTLASR